MSADYGRTLRPPRGVVSNRGKYMGNASLDIPVAYQSMVEHSAVNRVVVGSSPTRGAQPAAGGGAKRQRNGAWESP